MKVIEADTVWIIGVQGVFRKCVGCGKYKKIGNFGVIPGRKERTKRFTTMCHECYLPMPRTGRSGAHSRSYRLTPKGRQFADDLLREERAEQRNHE